MTHNHHHNLVCQKKKKKSRLAKSWQLAPPGLMGKKNVQFYIRQCGHIMDTYLATISSSVGRCRGHFYGTQQRSLTRSSIAQRELIYNKPPTTVYFPAPNHPPTLRFARDASSSTLRSAWSILSMMALPVFSRALWPSAMRVLPARSCVRQAVFIWRVGLRRREGGRSGGEPSRTVESTSLPTLANASSADDFDSFPRPGSSSFSAAEARAASSTRVGRSVPCQGGFGQGGQLTLQFLPRELRVAARGIEVVADEEGGAGADVGGETVLGIAGA